MSRRTRPYTLMLMLLCLAPQLHLKAQAPPFKKSVLDSMRVNDLKWNISFAFNFSQSENQSLTTYSDGALLYYSKRDDLHFDMSYYRDRYDQYSSANRFYIMYYMGIGSHGKVDGRLKEHKFYPEPFYLHSFDANRGIHARDQLGINAALNLNPTSFWRQKAGAGFFVERTNWQLIKHEKLAGIDTLPEDIQHLIYDTIGISREGRWARNNIFLNLYSNFTIVPVRNLNISGYLALQIPFQSPYGNLPQVPGFPTVTRRYARLTTNVQLTFYVWKKIALLTNFNLQYDKGQVPMYVPNVVYSWTQGLQLGF